MKTLNPYYLIPAAAAVFVACAIIHIINMVINHQVSINHLIN